MDGNVSTTIVAIGFAWDGKAPGSSIAFHRHAVWPKLNFGSISQEQDVFVSPCRNMFEVTKNIVN